MYYCTPYGACTLSKEQHQQPPASAPVSAHGSRSAQQASKQQGQRHQTGNGIGSFMQPGGLGRDGVKPTDESCAAAARPHRLPLPTHHPPTLLLLLTNHYYHHHQPRRAPVSLAVVACPVGASVGAGLLWTLGFPYAACVTIPMRRMASYYVVQTRRRVRQGGFAGWMRDLAQQARAGSGAGSGGELMSVHGYCRPRSHALAEEGLSCTSVGCIPVRVRVRVQPCCRTLWLANPSIPQSRVDI